MGLGFGGAGPDRRPAKGVGNVLRRDGIEQLGGSGNAQVQHLAKKSSGDTETFGNVAGAVKLGIHD